MKKNSYVFWLISAIIWAAIIFAFSSRTGVESNETSSSLASALSGALVPGFSTWAPSAQVEWLDGINGLVRKLAHFIEFGLLGILTYLAVLKLSGRKSRKKPATKFGIGMISFYICIAIAAVDEMLQLSSVGRTSMAGDILIDCAGAVLGIVLCAHKTKLPGTAAKQAPVAHRRG